MSPTQVWVLATYLDSDSVTGGAAPCEFLPCYTQHTGGPATEDTHDRIRFKSRYQNTQVCDASDEPVLPYRTELCFWKVHHDTIPKVLGDSIQKMRLAQQILKLA